MAVGSTRANYGMVCLKWVSAELLSSGVPVAAEAISLRYTDAPAEERAEGGVVEMGPIHIVGERLGMCPRFDRRRF